MSNSSNYRVGPPPAATASPAAAIGSLILFVGLFLIFMGFSEYYGGSTTRDMYRGTVLEGNADVNRIMSNTMDSGSAKMVLGIVALLVGGGIVAAGQASSRKKDENAN
jgi:hypothetical protein